MGDREEFLQIWHQHVSRPGSEKLLDWLDKKTDFFTAPASTRFHGACEGGLCMHSLNVYHALHDTFFTEGDSEESFAICALLHDLCKIGCYTPGVRNVKGADGKWTQVPTYNFNDPMPYGHGEKSVYVVNGFLRLTREEAFAIRYHMGFSGNEDSRQVGSAFQMYPLAFCLSVADMEATYFLENEG